MTYLSPIPDIRQSGSDKAGQNCLESGLKTPEGGEVVLIEDGQCLAEEGLVPAVGLAVQNDRANHNQLIVDLEQTRLVKKGPKDKV